ncbi:hypothetical protein HRbin41_01023 [bacterium HR41]|nr:hypothetical protein HRbin41_01023 [bacterium HR41]
MRLHAERGERQLVDIALGLARTDARRVDDHLEQVVEPGHHGPPARLPLAHVVGEERGAHAVAAQRRDEVHHRRVRLEMREVHLAEAVEREALGQLALDKAGELVLGKLAALPAVHRVLADRLCDALDRPAELGERQPRLALVGAKATLERGRQDPAEIRDESARSRPIGHGRGSRTVTVSMRKRRRSQRRPARRRSSRVGGSSKRRPTTSVMNPGVTRNAPPKITITPSCTSR